MMLLSTDEKEQGKAVQLIKELEPELANLANSLAQPMGQLQPIGVIEDGGGYDVVFGMRRALAFAYNHASGFKGFDEIEAKCYEGKISPVDLKLMALEENADREDESPIDKAMTFQWLKKEGGLSYKEIGDKVGWTDQNVRLHINLLDKVLEDKRLDIHTGKLSVDRANKLRSTRKSEGDGAEETRTSAGPGRRYKLPSVKGIESIYNAKAKPKDMEDKEWELWISEDVRRLLSLRLGFKFKPWKPGKPEKVKPEEENGAAKAKGGKVLKVRQGRATSLLICLGKTNARTYTPDQLKEKLENIVSIAEPGQKVEDESLQKLLDRLLDGYKEGLKVTIEPE